MKIKYKLLWGSIISLVLVVALNAWIYWDVKRMDAKTDEITSTWMPAAALLGDLDSLTGRFRQRQLMHSLESQEAKRGAYESEMDAYRQELSQVQQKIQPMIASTEEKGIYASFNQKWAEFLKAHDLRFIPLSHAGKGQEALQTILETQSLFEGASADLHKLVDLNEKNGLAASGQVDELFQWVSRLQVAASVLLTAFLGLFFYTLYRVIVRPLVQVADTADLIANTGDLTRQVEVSSKDEVGQLAAAFNKMVEGLSEVLKQVKDASVEVAGASTEIRAAA